MNDSRLLAMIAGYFGAFGCQRAENAALLEGDAWNPSQPVEAYNLADNGVGECNDIAWFKDRWWIAGKIVYNGSGSPQTYGLAYFDPATSKWIGVTMSGTQYGATGRALLRYDDGGGERLFFAQTAGGSALDDVRKIDFTAPSTVTCTDFGFRANVGAAGSQVNDMLVWDDGAGEKIYFVGFGFAVWGNNRYLARWNGSAFTAIGGPTTVTGNELRSLCAHDFKDGNGETLCVVGKFTTIGATAGYANMGSYRKDATWNKIGAGLALGNNQWVSSVASFNSRLWAGIGDDHVLSSTVKCLWALPNGAAAFVAAENLLVNLDADSLFNFESSTGLIKTSPIRSLCVYADRLHVAGHFHHRSIRRGMERSGPLDYWNGRVMNENGDLHGTIYRALPFLTGYSNALCAYGGGVVVAGLFSRGVEGGAPIRNVAVWSDPNDVTASGTFDSLGGGVNGEVFAACVYGGDLYVVGNFTEAGGVSCLNFAKWNGSAWSAVANITEGNALAMCVFDGDLIVVGEFGKVDGSATYKLAFAWDGSKHAVFDDISGIAGEEAILRACYTASDGTLYVGGAIYQVDVTGAGGLVTVNSIMKCAAGSNFNWLPLNDNDAGPTPGINVTTGSVYSIGENVVGGVTYIVVGCDPFAKGGNFSGTGEALWKWPPSAPDWTALEGALAGVYEPVKAIVNTSDAVSLWATFSGGTSIFLNHERVREFKSGANIWLGDGANGQDFEAQPNALAYCDAGAGDRLYIAGAARAVGSIIDSDACSLPAAGIVSIGRDDRIYDVAGGCGTTIYKNNLGLPFQAVTRIRRCVADLVTTEQQTLAVAGTPTAGVFTVTLDDAAGDSQTTAAIAWNATFATVISNINAALVTLLGSAKVTASGSTWNAIVFTFSGNGWAGRNNRIITADVSALTGATGAAASRTRTVKAATLAVTGAFNYANHGYSQHVAGIDMHGAVRSVGSLAGDYGGLGYSRAHDIKSVPYAELPAEFFNATYSDMAGGCEPTMPFAEIVSGNFKFAFNDHGVSDLDLGTVTETVRQDGLAVRYGGLWRNVGIAAGPFAVPLTVECFGGKLICAGEEAGDHAPHYYRWATSDWAYIADPTTGTNLKLSPRYMRAWSGKLWMVGAMQRRGSATWYPLVSWSGSAYATYTLPGYVAGTQAVNGICLASANIGGTTPVLYFGGTPDNVATTNPVLKTTDGATFTALGSNLVGQCVALATREYADGTFVVVAAGVLKVDATDCNVAYYDSTWHVGGFISGFGVPADHAMCGEFSGRQACDKILSRVIIGGSETEISNS